MKPNRAALPILKIALILLTVVAPFTDARATRVDCTVDEVAVATQSAAGQVTSLESLSDEQFLDIIRTLVGAGISRVPDLFRTPIARGREVFGLPFSGRRIYLESTRRWGSWPEALRLADVQRPRRGSLADRLSAENLERLGRLLAARSLLTVRRVRTMKAIELTPLFALMDPEFPAEHVPSGSALLELIVERFQSLNGFITHYSIGGASPARVRWSTNLILQSLRAMAPHMSLVNTDVRNLKDPEHPALIALRATCGNENVVGNALVKAVNDSEDFVDWPDAVRQALAETELRTAPIPVRRVNLPEATLLNAVSALVVAHAVTPLELSPDAMTNRENPAVAAILLQSLQYTVTPKAFYQQVTQLGGWEGLLIRSGLPASQITWTHQESQWTRAKITALLRALHATGADLHPTSLRLLSAADVLTRVPTVLQLLDGHSTSGNALCDGALNAFDGNFWAAVRAAELPYGTLYLTELRTNFFMELVPQRRSVDQNFIRQLGSTLSVYLSAADMAPLGASIQSNRRYPSNPWVNAVLLRYLDFIESYTRHIEPPPGSQPYEFRRSIETQILRSQSRSILLLADWMVPIFERLGTDAVETNSGQSAVPSHVEQRANQLRSIAPVFIHALLEIHRRSGLEAFQTRDVTGPSRRRGPPRVADADVLWKRIMEEVRTY